MGIFPNMPFNHPKNIQKISHNHPFFWRRGSKRGGGSNVWKNSQLIPYFFSWGLPLLSLNKYIFFLQNIIFFSFFGISQSLPSTSYIKMIEIWMIFTMIYPFAETFLVCLKDWLKTSTGGLKQGAKIVKCVLLISYCIVSEERVDKDVPCLNTSVPFFSHICLNQPLH